MGSGWAYEQGSKEVERVRRFVAAAPDAEATVVAIFPRDRARAAAMHAREASGLDVVVDEPADERTSMRAEMREEVDHAIFAPGSVGPFTKEQTIGIAWTVALCTIVGAALAFPIAFLSIGSISFAMRAAIAVFCGGFAGAAIGFVIGGGMPPRQQHTERMAADRGATVAVHGSDTERVSRAAQALAADGPIRLDVIVGEDPVETLITEREAGSHRHLRAVRIEHTGPEWFITHVEERPTLRQRLRLRYGRR